METILNYDTKKYPIMEYGYNDLNNDGVNDTLLFIWNGKKAAFISDNGCLPWGIDQEDKDWNEYFNNAFNTDSEPPVTWNEERSSWGGYMLLVDVDDCGRFDSSKDFYYKCIDINGDGKPEAEYFHNYTGIFPYSNKLHINLNGERDMSYLNFRNFSYSNDQRYVEGNKYVMNVHGSGFFLNNFSAVAKNSWENPIAWYDFDFDGYTNMVMRAADMHIEPPHLIRIGDTYEETILEFEVAFELNSNTSEQKYHSLDMQLTYYNYLKNPLDYSKYNDTVKGIKGLKEAEFLSEKLSEIRYETNRNYIPYMDGYKIGTDCENWDGVWLIFDEDDDDCRWEEMFSKHETVRNSSNDWYVYSDRIGDRIEIDKDYKGKGNLYIGKFDGRIHLYHAEEAFWDIDYLAQFKGSIDRLGTDEGPEPKKGMRYPRVRYYDKNNNGFIDTIEYVTVEYQNEENTQIIEKVISLLDYYGDNEDSDICELIDPRVDSKTSGWRIETWDGNPLKADDFEGTSCKDGFNKIYSLYTKVSDDMWNNALILYKTAKEFNLNKSENLDVNINEKYSKEELMSLKEIKIPKGYSKHLTGSDRRERYNNGFWLREKVFRDILEYSKLDKYELEKLYYTGQINKLCKYICNNLELKEK